MTTRENIEGVLAKAWEAHKTEEQPYTTTEYLLTAVQLIHGQVQAQEARYLPPGLPQDAPEASGGTNVPQDLESFAKGQLEIINEALIALATRQREAIKEALVWLRGDYKNKAIEELEKVL